MKKAKEFRSSRRKKLHEVRLLAQVKAIKSIRSIRKRWANKMFLKAYEEAIRHGIDPYPLWVIWNEKEKEKK